MSCDNPSDSKLKWGEETRREVLGNDHVDRSQSRVNAFNSRFQELITEGAWGHLWSDKTWTKRERSMVTIALLAAQGNDEELAMHIRATRNTGASHEDIREALMHVAIYAGVPKANSAIKIAENVFAEMNEAERE